MHAPNSSDYRELFYAKYSSTHVEPRKGRATYDMHRARYGTWERLIAPYLPSNLSANIVDIGCGSGAIIQWLLSRGYYNSFGIDGSSEVVAVTGHLGLPVKQQSAQDTLTELPSHFDFIVLRNVLEHHTKDEVVELLQRVHAALVPQGSVWIQVPNAECPFGARLRYADFTHELAFTKTSMAQVLRVTGFVDFIIRPVEPHHRSLWRRTKWRLAKYIYRKMISAELGHSDCLFTQDLYALATKA